MSSVEGGVWIRRVIDGFGFALVDDGEAGDEVEADASGMINLESTGVGGLLSIKDRAAHQAPTGIREKLWEVWREVLTLNARRHIRPIVG